MPVNEKAAQTALIDSFNASHVRDFDTILGAVRKVSCEPTQNVESNAFFVAVRSLTYFELTDDHRARLFDANRDAFRRRLVLVQDADDTYTMTVRTRDKKLVSVTFEKDSQVVRILDLKAEYFAFKDTLRQFMRVVDRVSRHLGATRVDASVMIAEQIDFRLGKFDATTYSITRTTYPKDIRDVVPLALTPGTHAFPATDDEEDAFLDRLRRVAVDVSDEDDYLATNIFRYLVDDVVRAQICAHVSKLKIEILRGDDIRRLDGGRISICACKDEMSPGFLREDIIPFAHTCVQVVFADKWPVGAVFIADLTSDSSDAWELTVVCGANVGRLLMDVVDDLAATRGVVTLHVMSVIGAIGFYLKMGFRHENHPDVTVDDESTRPEGRNNLWPMSRRVSQRASRMIDSHERKRLRTK